MNFPFLPRTHHLLIALAVVLTAATTGQAAVVELYDPAQNSLPGQQGWLPLVLPPAQQSFSGGLTNLDTTATYDARGGYFSEAPWDGSLKHPNMPVLDRMLGYTVRFDLQVVSEGHGVGNDLRDDNGDGLADRAGLSVITVSQDLLGLELGFFEDRVWAYAADGESANSLFTQAEGVAFDTTTRLTHYELAVQGNSYHLSADGSEILTGSLRNYSDNVVDNNVDSLVDPYDNQSFLFFGDDTRSADSNMLLGAISVSTVPEPSAWALMLLATGGLALLVRRRQADLNDRI